MARPLREGGEGRRSELILIDPHPRGSLHRPLSPNPAFLHDPPTRQRRPARAGRAATSDPPSRNHNE
eukprot:7099130-Pyramimonas_sp.AAC.1